MRFTSSFLGIRKIGQHLGNDSYKVYIIDTVAMWPSPAAIFLNPIFRICIQMERYPPFNEVGWVTENRGDNARASRRRLGPEQPHYSVGLRLHGKQEGFLL